MSQLLKPTLQRAKQRAKFFKPMRMLAAPFMQARLDREESAYLQSTDSAYVKSLENTHGGERCFIIGNGPSLQPGDLDALQHEQTFAANGIYKVFGETSWRPTYFVCIDQNFLVFNTDLLENIEADHIFLDTYAKKLIGPAHDNITFINERRKKWTTDKFSLDAIGFSDAPYRCVYAGHTVTYAAMQLAIYMGFSEIYLLGVDHSYPKAVDAQGHFSTVTDSPTHFFTSESRGGYYYYEGVEHAYRLAKQAANRHGCAIRNATRGGFLEIFERVDFDQLIAPDNP